mmetsp:Transcript_22714/g.64966  ORF Transcript_22714/g.64966 Transcript_22714/m.64966 type:complete len:109 (+) Transcript_22714:121-447(+)
MTIHHIMHPQDRSANQASAPHRTLKAFTKRSSHTCREGEGKAASPFKPNKTHAHKAACPFSHPSTSLSLSVCLSVCLASTIGQRTKDKDVWEGESTDTQTGRQTEKQT